jgi:hypothetical protein
MHSLSPEYLARLRFDRQQLATLRALGEYRDKRPLDIVHSPEVLSDLHQVAVIESTESSNRLEGAAIAAARRALEGQQQRPHGTPQQITENIEL